MLPVGGESLIETGGLIVLSFASVASSVPAASASWSSGRPVWLWVDAPALSASASSSPVDDQDHQDAPSPAAFCARSWPSSSPHRLRQAAPGQPPAPVPEPCRGSQ